MIVEQYLMGKGIKLRHKGFKFLVEAINLCEKDNSYLDFIRAKLYPKIAEIKNTTPKAVESSIRNSIKCAGHTMSNIEFINFIMLDIRNQKE